jgi:hypothetical protein
VAVEVDEAGNDDEPAHVDGRLALETVPDRRNRISIDPHVAHAVLPGLGVDDPTTGQHQVVRHEPTSSDRTPAAWAEPTTTARREAQRCRLSPTLVRDIADHTEIRCPTVGRRSPIDRLATESGAVRCR